MLKWTKLYKNTELIETEIAFVPLYRLSEHHVVLIDSGPEEDPELIRELDRRNLRVRAILCTHIHPDHIANNAALVSRYGAEIYASEKEFETLQEIYARLRKTYGKPNKRYLEPQYQIHPIGPVSSIKIDGASFGIIPIPGHTLGQLAFVTPDGVCCLGDAMLSTGRLALSKLPYLEDTALSISTMEQIGKTDYPFYITSHKGITAQKDLSELVSLNIQKELELYEILRTIIKKPTKLDDVLTEFLQKIHLSPKAIESPLIRHSAATRIYALVQAGEYHLKGDFLF